MATKGTGRSPLTAKKSSGGGAGVVTLYTTPGSATYTVPSGTTSIKVEAWGGGGGATGNDYINGAGAGGAYATSTISVTSGQTVYLNVGAGGLGGNTSATAGGDSWVNKSSNNIPASDTTLGCIAKGGATYPTGIPNNTNQSFPGSLGTTIYIGGAGGSGGNENGGGGSAGPTGNGSPGLGGNGVAGGASASGAAGGCGGGSTQSGGNGESNINGGGGGGGSYNNSGGDGGVPGGGGGMGFDVQAASCGTTTNTAYGGDGGRGQVRITTQN